jgi:hypothetical protein
MRRIQIIGWTADGTKVTGRHTEEARRRGAVGQLWRERDDQWNAKTTQCEVVMEMVTEHASA